MLSPVDKVMGEFHDGKDKFQWCENPLGFWVTHMILTVWEENGEDDRSSNEATPKEAFKDDRHTNED